MSDELNYVVAAVEKVLRNVQWQLECDRDQLTKLCETTEQLRGNIAEKEAQEAQLVSFLDFRKKQ
jgi:hypothetical protein